MVNNIKKLVFFPSDPIDAYIAQGYSYQHLEGYYNPGNFFDEVYCLSPWKSQCDQFGKIKCICARPRNFKKIIKQISPNVVRGYGGFWCADWIAISKVSGIPTVVSLHDTNPALMFKTIKCADMVVCMSEAVRQVAVKKFGFNPNDLLILPNRVNTNLFKKTIDKQKFHELNFRFGSGKHILHVGRKSEEKNLETVIWALQFLEDDFSCIFVGRGNSNKYKELAKEIGVDRRCFWVESIKNEELPLWYSWCDCMCTPSKWEGFGIVFIEAAACEAVVVTSNIAPMNEFFDESNAVLVDDYTNAHDIANAIRFATSKKDVVKNIKKKAREVGVRFSKDVIDNYEIGLYKKAMGLVANNRSVLKLPVIWKYRNFI